MKKSVRVVFALVFAFSTAGLSASPFIFEPMRFPSARTDALGGLHAALADDFSVLQSNPAGLRSAGPQFSVAELTTDLNGPIFSIADLFLRIVQGGNPTSLLQDPDVQKLLTSLDAGITINGPLALGYIGEGLGFGFFNSSGADFTTEGTVPTVTTDLKEDLMFVAGYGFRIPLPENLNSTLDLGFSLKTFTRAHIEWSESILSFFSAITSPSLSYFLNQPFDLDVGFGMDAGALYSWNNLISVGLAARDLYSPVLRNYYQSGVSGFTSGATPVVTYGIVPLDVALGILYTPRLGFLESYMSNLKLMLDYGDIFDFWTHPATASNPLLHFGLGAEVTLLDVLAVRAGFGDGYFSAGLGMNLTAFHLDLTMFGRELSTEPGLRPSFNLIVSTLFRY
jgi:hypothetical protein